MSLAEMVNLAGGIQSYQQAQQLNPLAVQRSAAELSRLQQLTPEELRRAKAQAESAEIEATVSEKTSKPRITTSEATASSAESTAEKDRINLLNQKLKNIASSQIAMINNPLILQAEKNPNAVNTQQLVDLVMRNGMTIARDLNIKPDEAKALLQPYVDIAINNPGQLRQYFKERHLAGLDEASRTSALSPSGIGIDYGTGGQTTSTNEFSAVPLGRPIPGTAFNRQLMPGESIVTDATGNNFIQSKDSQGRISIRPVTEGGSSVAPSSSSITNMPAPAQIQNAPPQVQTLPPAQTPQPAPSAVVAPKPSAVSKKLSEQPAEAPANVPVYSQAVPPRFPVRQPGQPAFTLQQGEKEAQVAGGEYVRNIVAQRGAVSPVRTNLEKIMSKTDQLLAKQGFEAGKGLQLEQYLTKLVDDSEYKELSKQFANLQATLIGNNPQAMSTDAGKAMAAAQTGSEVYPPKVLQKIVVQLHGEMENRDKQGIAADKYARRFGESNMGSFTQMWNNNADNKVFELMSLPKLVKDPQMRAKMADEIIGYPKNSEQRKVFEQKYKNIQKLINDGTL
jgi:hypothetical protein